MTADEIQRAIELNTYKRKRMLDAYSALGIDEDNPLTYNEVNHIYFEVVEIALNRLRDTLEYEHARLLSAAKRLNNRLKNTKP